MICVQNFAAVRCAVFDFVAKDAIKATFKYCIDLGYLAGTELKWKFKVKTHKQK